jgi:GMP synthase-like glutamine amidotransferase
VGVHRVDLVAREPWMVPPAEACALHFMHQDQVTALPEGGVVVGSTGHCPVAAFRVGTAMVGIQAHPEFTPEYSGALLDQREERIGAEKVAAARASLALPTDEATVARWLARFLGAGRERA